MLKRVLLACVVVMLIGGAGYAQSQPVPVSKRVKTKSPRKAKVPPIKKPKEPPLTPGERAIRKANEKSIQGQRKAFEKEKKQAAKEITAQRKAYLKALREAEKRAKKK